MNGGHACCAIGLCCKARPDRIKALAEMIEHFHALVETNGNLYHDAARVVLEHFDLVPLGLGDAIIRSYEPHFAEKAKKE